MVWFMPLRACVHVTHGTWLNDSFRAMCQVRVKDMCQVVRKVGGSFPALINPVDRQKKKREKRKKKKREKEKQKKWIGQCVKRKKEKKKKGTTLPFVISG